MSLILEALKKLEREKETPDRGFLVMAQVPWVGEGRRGKIVLVLGAVLALSAVVLGVRWLAGGRGKSPPAAAASVPPTPSTAAASPAASAGLPPPPRSAGPAEVVSAVPRYLPPPQRQAFPASPRAAQPSAVSRPSAAPPALAPQAPSAAAPQSAGALRLEAVSEQDGVAIAVINGQLVREGDRIGEGTVVRIGVQEVEIEVAGRRSVLRF